MIYKVVLSETALLAIREFIEYLSEVVQDYLPAEEWWEKAYARIQTLSSMPNRCPTAPENEYRDYTIRALVVDSHVFLYRVDEQNRRVEIVGFRHGAQLPRQQDLPVD